MNRLRQFFPSSPDPSSTDGDSSSWDRSVLVLSVIGMLAVALVGMDRPDTLARELVSRLHTFAVAPAVPETDPDTTLTRSRTIRLQGLPAHPAVRYRSYFSPSVFGTARPDSTVRGQFHDLLTLYINRQSVDDNYTLRVKDKRTGEVLEVHRLDDLEARYGTSASVDWRRIDDYRRRATRRLVDKYVARGIPKEAIMVRWGRSNQVQNAHERDAPYKEYEMRLAQYLDLSLLPTEIGTVETFNQDDLVSPVGARSRYQMMPWILRRLGVNTYSLQTETGAWQRVREEWHPLLTLEPAFTLLRGYVNAVGHEIPGLSAYHTGPGNIYKIFRLYYTKSRHFSPSATVVDAYLWGLTEGFETVRAQSSFGPYSRGYVPAAFGALTATDDHPLDPSQTLRAVRVQLRPGAQVSLRALLTAIDSTAQPLDWGPGVQSRSLYERFRALNPHFDLPASPDGELPPRGNVRLVASVDGDAVRFFLPLGAPALLRAAGLDVLDADRTFRFDRSTYTDPPPAETTVWDRRYDALVDDIRDFGFTPDNRERLLRLYEKFVTLAEEHPDSHYRQMQLGIIRTHRRIWTSDVWNKLSDATMVATGRTRMPVQPPVTIRTPSPDLDPTSAP
jgi:hypothetical protein